MEFFMIQNSDLIFAKILVGRPLRPYLQSQLAVTAKKAHFQGQVIPEAEPVGTYGQNGLFSRSNDPRSRILTLFLPNFSWTSVKTLPMEPVGPYGQNGPFSRSNVPQSRKTPIFDFCVL
ncbi:hypothetical protein H5410_064067 [Solanum commersonii]|uniref:Uncharacterized protein n=1 Tax=Solanum commersonii TaxID=4109 RepID=A0A9J5W0K4_SOLCO|nr:hypothetical protein H5410_064067 [Solanum commersonii]